MVLHFLKTLFVFLGMLIIGILGVIIVNFFNGEEISTNDNLGGIIKANIEKLNFFAK